MIKRDIVEKDAVMEKKNRTEGKEVVITCIEIDKLIVDMKRITNYRN